MPPTTLLLLALAAGVAGFSIGCVGIGGVLMIPALAYLGGLDMHLAMATTVWGVAFTGAAGTMLFARRGSIDWRLAGWLSAGAAPGSFLGARTNLSLADTTLETILAALIIATGAQALARPVTVPRSADRLPAPLLLLLGTAVGFGSALTGTGGALLLVPLLILLRVPVLAAVGASQVIQLPVALLGSLGFTLYGRVLYLLGTGLALVEVLGVWAGVRTAHALPTPALRRVVALALIAAGVLMLLE